MPRINDRSNANHIFVDHSNREMLGQSLSAGASYALVSQKPFLLKDALLPFYATLNKRGQEHTVHYSIKRQFKEWEELWANPFCAPYILCISASPTDLLAQMVGMRLFLRAIDRANENNLCTPLWHQIYGGVRDDRLREGAVENVPFLVLGGCVTTSTPYKLEKLRDILDMHSEIPRVVVTSDSDPLDFMYSKLKISPNYCLMLGHQYSKRWEG